MAIDVSRRGFVGGSAAVAGGLALGGPMSALARRASEDRRARGGGYGRLRPTREIDSGEIYLELPAGFSYRLISRQNDPMDDGNPTPGIFDGMAAYPGPGGSTVLIRNHENRSRGGEIPVQVPSALRYDPEPNVRGGNTKLVVSNARRVVESYAVLAGTHTNCAGGVTPWDSWITCEEIFNYGWIEDNVTPGTGVAHGYAFEVSANVDGPVKATPIKGAGRFSHEAVAWLDGALYETEDRGNACFYRFLPSSSPTETGDLESADGVLEALVVSGRPNFDANLADPGDTFEVEWVEIEEPDPPADTVREEAQSKGAAIFDRTEGIWATEGRLYFDCTTGGEEQLGQLWELTLGGAGSGTLKLIYESTGVDDLDSPDNLVIVPASGHVFLQEDGGDEQYVRGVTPGGRIYDFARTVLNSTEFCGGCFSPDGHTFFLNQQGDRGTVTDTGAALTYAIWGPFSAVARGGG
jgi:uncharacterized protein